MKHLTPEEQQHLMRYLPSVDTDLPPKRFVCLFSIRITVFNLQNDFFIRFGIYFQIIATLSDMYNDILYFCSLGSMFSSIQFEETFYYFQQLIQEGVFDLSFCANSDDCRTLKKLLLLNLKKINWIERYRMLKVSNSHNSHIKFIVASSCQCRVNHSSELCCYFIVILGF